MKKLCIVLLFITVQVEGQQIDLAVIAAIESSNNPKAINKTDGGSRGIYQIHPTCLKDYNNITHSNYEPDDLFDPLINKKIAVWMFTVRIPGMLTKYKLAHTIDNKLICYNAGITYLTNKNKRVPASTLSYINKYKELNKKKIL